MSTGSSITRLRAILAGRWQVPLLGLSLVLLAIGVLRIVVNYRPKTFAEQVAAVEQLREAGRLRRANLYTTELLRQEGRPASEQAELHRQLAAVIFDAEAGLTRHATANVRAVIANLEKATRLGATLGAEDWQRLGAAHEWLGEEDAAVAALRACLQTGAGPARPDLVRRRIVELRSRFGAGLPDDAASVLDEMLEDQGTPAESFEWALERKVEWLLARGESRVARRVIADARTRLGTSAGRGVEYLEGLCLFEEGDDVAAERALRSQLNESPSRDEKWCRTARLLGQLAQRQERLDEALTHYEAAMRAIGAGETYDACALGRAECLALLGRHEEALRAFEGLTEDILPVRRHRYVDRKAVRTLLTSLAETLEQDASTADAARAMAPRFLAMAMELTSAEEAALRRTYLLRLAAMYSGCAERAARPGGSRDGLLTSIEPDAAAREYWERAGECYLAGGRLWREDEEEFADAIWRAAEAFRRAGRSSRMLGLIDSFVRNDRASRHRLAALRALGEAHMAEGRWSAAASAFDEAIAAYSPLPDALASMPALARCLIAQGGVSARRGVEILKDIVDDRGPKSLFTPQAREFRDALVMLAEYYAQADVENEPEHCERAIERLEDVLAFYPSDAHAPRWRFLLGESYRRSAGMIQKAARAVKDGKPEGETNRVRRDRLVAALACYEGVQAALSAADEATLNDVERVQLEASCLLAADCLFDLGDFPRAIEAYEKAAWRYQATPTALMAAMQIAQCHERTGRPSEARAALRRAAWLVRTLPADAFTGRPGMPPRDFWVDMVDRLDRMGTQLAMSS